MFSQNRLAAFIFGAALAIAAGGTARAAGPIDPYLPKSGTIAGHVMSFEVSPEDQAISRQFRSAVQNNMDWFKKAVTGSKPGEPLPYDHRMGITQAQYEQLQHMHADFKPGATVSVAVKRAADGSITFDPQGDDATTLKGVIIAPDEKSAKTPFGTLAIFNEIHQTDAKKPIGVWNGVELAKVEPADAEEPSAKLAFGKRAADGSGVMYFQIAPYKDHKEQSLVIFYGLD